MINLKSSAVLAALLAGACAAPETPAPVLSWNDPAIVIYNSHCSNRTFTGHGMGFSNCVSKGLERESLARASGGHDAIYTAALR